MRIAVELALRSFPAAEYRARRANLVSSAPRICHERGFMPEPVKVGVIGTGAISGAYLGMAKNFPIVEMAACADMDIERAKQAAEKFEIPKVLSVDDLLADPSIEVVLN